MWWLGETDESIRCNEQAFAAFRARAEPAQAVLAAIGLSLIYRASLGNEIEFLTRSFGPLIHAREVTEADGRWPKLRGELAQFFERNEAGEYLLTLGRGTG